MAETIGNIALLTILGALIAFCISMARIYSCALKKERDLARLQAQSRAHYREWQERMAARFEDAA